MFRYIYLRSQPSQVKAGVYPQAGLPVGCLAYKDSGDDNFAFGLSFLNSEVDSVSRAEARKIATERLKIALSGKERKMSQGRFGTVKVSGDSLNKKLYSLIKTIVNDSSIHNRASISDRVKYQLTAVSAKLLQPKKVD